MLELIRPDLGYLYPVGRLDYDSEGLLLLTNDGELAARLMHPRHEVPKVYRARVRGVPDAQRDRTPQHAASRSTATAPRRPASAC